MKKNIYITIFIFVIINSLLSQNINFEKQIINNNNYGFSSTIYCSDIDGDNDLDILYYSSNDNEIAWVENLDGLGHFSVKQVICSNIFGVTVINSSDIDNDGDNDLLFTANDSIIMWYDNTDGTGAFLLKQLMSVGVNITNFILSDLNNDSYIDLIYTSNMNELSWCKNLSGNVFDNKVYIGESDPISEIISKDIDNDGDNDLVYTSGPNGKVMYKLNLDGLGTFESNNYSIGNILMSYVFSIFVDDINGDTKQDVGLISGQSNLIGWFDNAEGLNYYSVCNTVDTIIYTDPMLLGSKNSIIKTNDFDNDSKIDILTYLTESNNSQTTLLIYKNSDFVSFNEKQYVDTNIVLYDINVVDIDGDDYADIVYISNNSLGWYKNLLIDNIAKINQTSFTIYPNPTKNTITVQTEFEITKIELYNNLGQLVLTELNSKTINVSNLAKGVYNCKVFGNNSGLGIEQIIIE